MSIIMLINLSFSFGQTYDTTQYFGKMNYVFQNVNKTLVTSGFLKDYGIEFLNLDNYKGNILHDSNFVSIDEWRLLYTSLYSSQVNSNANMLYLDTINRLINKYNYTSMPVTFAGLYYSYQRFRDDAVTANLISISNGRLYDVAGRTQNPYESKRLFAAVPVNQYSTDGSESFIYRSNMVWGNTSLTISQLQINFGNGTGLQTLTANTPININYADTGAYVWTIRATLSDNSIVQCYSDYFVLAVQSGSQRFLPSNITTPSWGSIAPIAGVHSGATINVIYSTKQPSGTLRKPLIVVENMDAFLIAPSLQTEPYDIRTFLTAIKSSEPNFDFNQQLDFEAGYDLVFIDFTNGTDGIVRNAAVV